MRIGYFLSSEEYDPRELVEQARLAQGAGLDQLWISDHYHPWTEAYVSRVRIERLGGRRGRRRRG